MSLEVRGSKYNSNNAPEVTKATQDSSEWNCEFIGEIAKQYLRPNDSVFEVGTGTAHQVKYYAKLFPETTFQTSSHETDTFVHIGNTLTENGQQPWPDNVRGPVLFDMDQAPKIPCGTYDVVYSSNVLHCVPESSGQRLFQQASTALKVKGLFILYGPFNMAHPEKYGVQAVNRVEGTFYTSPGNERFDARLKTQDPRLGVRDLDSIVEVAESCGLGLVNVHEHVEANNYVVVFRKTL